MATTTYRAYRPDIRQTLIDLARALSGPVICHRSDLDSLRAAGVPAAPLARNGGPLTGELWVEIDGGRHEMG